jgi:hypothetical protein
MALNAVFLGHLLEWDGSVGFCMYTLRVCLNGMDYFIEAWHLRLYGEKIQVVLTPGLLQ